jgi:hypothetical protein
MSQFIKLTSKIINKNLISSVYIKPSKYVIYTIENNIDGHMIFGSGYIDSKPEKIEVWEKEDYKDYKIISDWIDSIKN